MNSLPAASWQRVLVLAVHPDDESLSAGGLIQTAIARGSDVRVVFITDGDNNPWPQRFIERRWHIDAAGRARWGARRRAEAVAALATLGLPAKNISFWHYPDQKLTRLLMQGGDELIEILAAIICQWQPTLLLSPSPNDLHPDHNALAVLLHFAAERSSLFRARSFVWLHYLVHTRGTQPAEENIQLSLSPGQVDCKRQAILHHVTQVTLSRRRFLAFAKPVEVFPTPRPYLPDDPAHPIFSADFSGEHLCLKIGRLALPFQILLAAETATRVVRHSITFPPGNAPAIFDATTGKLRGHVRLVRRITHDEIYLPEVLFATAPGVFVKVAAKWGFYDRSGWRMIPLTPARTRAEQEENQREIGARICCVIPCYNLAGICGPIVRAAAGFADHVIAVNDGSLDETAQVLRRVEQQCRGKVQVLQLPRNRGKGIALLEAFRLSQALPFDVLVTLDGDGQHRPEDIPRLARAMVGGGYDLVIGERLAREKMPLRSRLGNSLTAAVLKCFHPGAPTDTQSGFRAFHRDFVHEIVGTISGGRYETELEILLLALQRGRHIGSVTIPTVYLDGNRLSHFRPIVDSWRIYRTLFRRHFAPAEVCTLFEKNHFMGGRVEFPRVTDDYSAAEK